VAVSWRKHVTPWATFVGSLVKQQVCELIVMAESEASDYQLFGKATKRLSYGNCDK
jgi:hypothetical protein